MTQPDEQILIFDFGSQYAQLIARRVREQHVFCQLVRANITAETQGDIRRAVDSALRLLDAGKLRVAEKISFQGGAA